MKHWNIDEFIAECEKLCRDEYGYAYSNMPEMRLLYFADITVDGMG